MIQQINLYQPNANEAIFELRANHMLWVSLGLMVVLLVATLMQIWQNGNFDNRREQSESRLRDATAQTDLVKTRFPEIHVDPNLKQEVLNSRRKLAETRKILRYLTENESQRRQGFSPYFEGLARQTVPKVWFSGVSVRDGGENLKLDGSTLIPKQVPKLFQLLKKEAAFRGKIFSRLVMEKQQEKSGQVDFSIHTKDIKEADNAGA